MIHLLYSSILDCLINTKRLKKVAYSLLLLIVYISGSGYFFCKLTSFANFQNQISWSWSSESWQKELWFASDHHSPMVTIKAHGLPLWMYLCSFSIWHVHSVTLRLKVFSNSSLHLSDFCGVIWKCTISSSTLQGNLLLCRAWNNVNRQCPVKNRFCLTRHSVWLFVLVKINLIPR